MEYLRIGMEQMEELIPQRTPMIMVDGLLVCDDQSTVSTLTILNSNIFVQDSLLQESGLLENMAQTAALRAGYRAQLEGTKPVVGFIGAIKRLHIKRLPKTYEKLITRIVLVNELLGAMIVHATTTVKDQIIAEADLSIFLTEPTKTPHS